MFGNFYGTGIESVRQMSEAGYDVILEIDVQGAAQVRRALPEAVGIFILPPSLAVLAERLRGRGTDSAEVIERPAGFGRRGNSGSAVFRLRGHLTTISIRPKPSCWRLSAPSAAV